MKMHKKGAMDLAQASVAAIYFVLFVIILGIGATILAGIQVTQVVDSVAYNASGFGLIGITNIAQQSGTIGIVLAAAILIGLVVTAFLGGMRMDGGRVA